MPNSFFGLTIGSSGLFSSNINLNTTAHNISNAETKGYSRQAANQVAATPIPAHASYGMMGTGSTIKSVDQQRSEYYDCKFRSNNTISGFYDAQKYYMDSIENYLNEIQLDGFNHNFDTMFNALQELSKDPSSLSVRTEVNSFSQNFCDYINALSTSLSRLSEDTNFEVKTEVDTINSLATQIVGLTRQINTLEVTGEKANDLRDARNLLVDELSGIVDISVREEIVGEDVGVTSYTVKIGDNTLVDTYDCYQLKVVTREDKVNQSDLNGLYDVQWKNGQSFNALRCGGKLQALMEVRDGNNQANFTGKVTASYGDTTITLTDSNVNKTELLHINQTGIITIGSMECRYTGFQVTQDDDGNFIYEFSLAEGLKKDVTDYDAFIGQSIEYKGIAYYQQQLDEFVRVFSKAYNDICTQGSDLYGEKGLDYFNGRNILTGENFVFGRSEDQIENDILFSSKTGDYYIEDEEENYGSYYLMTASNFEVTRAVHSDPRRLVAATQVVDGVEQNDIAMALIGLKSDERMFKQGTPSEFLQSLIAELGVDSSKATAFAQNQADVLASIGNQRLSISGVDTDEEAMNLVRFQNAYNLSSKVISTMNQIYNKLINETGV